MSIAADTYRMALNADERTGAVTVGRRFDASTLGPVPANVRVEPWIDQARVLDQADTVVCHGGSGTTLAQLAAGTPARDGASLR
jgi:UDP:flavonoid glycosyltransferase YjiC (YdhE family)